MRWPRFAPAILLGALAACGNATPTDVRADGPTRDPRQRYEIDAEVVADATHGPQVCTTTIEGAPAFSPDAPRTKTCDYPVAGLDWPHEWRSERLHLVGTFDGATFTLTEPPRPAQQPPPAPMPEFKPSCAEPPTGFPVVDPTKATGEARTAAIEHARSQPDIAGVWLANGAVLNLTFTGELGRHELEARQAWGGPLCVSRAAHSSAELGAIAQRLCDEESKRILVQCFEYGQDEIRNLVYATVLIADDVSQHWVETTFGEGLVELTGRFLPVASDET